MIDIPTDSKGITMKSIASEARHYNFRISGLIEPFARGNWRPMHRVNVLGSTRVYFGTVMNAIACINIDHLKGWRVYPGY